jgi:quercetin 2,3-dioxygenase
VRPNHHCSCLPTPLPFPLSSSLSTRSRTGVPCARRTHTLTYAHRAFSAFHLAPSQIPTSPPLVTFLHRLPLPALLLSLTRHFTLLIPLCLLYFCVSFFCCRLVPRLRCSVLKLPSIPSFPLTASPGTLCHPPSHPHSLPPTASLALSVALLLASLIFAALLATVPRARLFPLTPTSPVTPADMASTTAAAAVSATAPTKVIREVFALGRSPFKTFDPFLFCVYHNDAYPASTKDSLGPDPKLLKRRDIGSDFSYEDGWSMYHGTTVPGFPAHPHRGFETITVTRKGFVDHSDSVKCTARYGEGDTQWLTAGGGIQHTEMFPLVHADRPNTVQLFQVWLNLPRKNKMCAPYFSMFWKEETPMAELATQPLRAGGAAPAGRAVAKVVAGELDGVTPLPPPPDSWAAARDADVAVWTVDIPANGRVTLPAARGGASTTRAVYFVKGGQLEVGDGEAVVGAMNGARVAAEVPLVLGAVGGPAEVLVLQGRAIGEPVVQHGPFVMNTREEILQCFADYRRTEFGGWPWESSDHVHPRDMPRHAVHMDGRKEFPPNKPDTAAPKKAAGTSPEPEAKE